MTTAGALCVLARGMTRRCGRCGGGKLFRRWFTMIDRCPRCGMRFEREEGFFLGAYVINYAAAATVVAVVLAVVIALEAQHPGLNLLPVIAVGALVAVATPIVFFPFSRTLWSAIELVMKPLEVTEEAAAVLATDGRASSQESLPDR